MNNPRRVQWDLVIMVCAIWNCFTLPIAVTFNTFETPPFVIVNAIVDCLFMADIIIIFRTSYINTFTGDEVADPRKICKNYLKTRFWIDLLATIPFDTFAGFFQKPG